MGQGSREELDGRTLHNDLNLLCENRFFGVGRGGNREQNGFLGPGVKGLWGISRRRFKWFSEKWFFGAWHQGAVGY